MTEGGIGRLLHGCRWDVTHGDPCARKSRTHQGTGTAGKLQQMSNHTAVCSSTSGFNKMANMDCNKSPTKKKIEYLYWRILEVTCTENCVFFGQYMLSKAKNKSLSANCGTIDLGGGGTSRGKVPEAVARTGSQINSGWSEVIEGPGVRQGRGEAPAIHTGMRLDGILKMEVENNWTGARTVKSVWRIGTRNSSQG